MTDTKPVYLPRFFLPKPREKEPKWPRVGILVNGCTGRSLVGLLKEKQVPRENTVIVGVPCGGMIDIKKIKGIDIIEGTEKKSSIIVKDRAGKEKELKKDGLMADICLSCSCSVPPVYDYLIKGKGKETVVPYTGVEEFGKM